ncbi:MAG: hypothetical protein J5803_00950 [Desulfovibrio sp.]|nr:hypothetical protein [Desulfovibrio sp.]
MRHPLLRDNEIAQIVLEGMIETMGFSDVAVNTTTGSVLIHYDSETLSKDQLIEMGIAWAQYLDDCKKGKRADPPVF